MPETIEAVETVRRQEEDGELPLEEVVWIADNCGACPDATLLLSRLVMTDVNLDYVPYIARYSCPMVVWSREVARAILAMGVPIDGAKFRDANGTELTADCLYWIGCGGLDVAPPEISSAEDVLGLMEDQRIAEQQAEPPLQRAA